MTIEQFEALPDEVTARHELVEGELVTVSSPTPKNTLVRDDLRFLLKMWALKHKTATAFCELNVQTQAGTVRRPDIAIFSADQMRRIDMNQVPVPNAAMIAVEILSPSEAMVDVSRKAVEYLKAGSREVWLVDHENRELHVRTAEGQRLLVENMNLETGLLPGFSALVAHLFAFEY